MRNALGAFMVVAIVAGHAHAQSQSGSSSALAEQLFNQGRDLIKAKQWAEACPKFEASLRYEHIGKLASATLGYAHLSLSLMRLALFEKNV